MRNSLPPFSHLDLEPLGGIVASVSGRWVAHVQTVAPLFGNGWGMMEMPRAPDAFERAASAGRLASVGRRLRCHRAPVGEVACSHALSAAARAGHLSVVKLLIPRVGPEYHHAAFLHASAGGHDAIVARLLPLAKPRSLDSWGLIMAAQLGHTAVVRRLLPESDPAGDAYQGLRLAASGCHTDVVGLLWPHVRDARALTEAAVAEKQWGALDFLASRLPPACLTHAAAAAPAASAPHLHARWLDLTLGKSLPRSAACSAPLSRL